MIFGGPHFATILADKYSEKQKIYTELYVTRTLIKGRMKAVPFEMRPVTLQDGESGSRHDSALQMGIAVDYDMKCVCTLFSKLLKSFWLASR